MSPRDLTHVQFITILLINDLVYPDQAYVIELLHYLNLSEDILVGVFYLDGPAQLRSHILLLLLQLALAIRFHGLKV